MDLGEEGLVVKLGGVEEVGVAKGYVVGDVMVDVVCTAETLNTALYVAEYAMGYQML